jgi:hypothetical protein
MVSRQCLCFSRSKTHFICLWNCFFCVWYLSYAPYDKYSHTERFVQLIHFIELKWIQPFHSSSWKFKSRWIGSSFHRSFNSTISNSFLSMLVCRTFRRHFFKGISAVPLSPWYFHSLNRKKGKKWSFYKESSVVIKRSFRWSIGSKSTAECTIKRRFFVLWISCSFQGGQRTFSWFNPEPSRRV